MINIRIFGDKQAPTGYEAAGHAEYAQEGYDIICSAISTLTISCANGLEQVVKCPVTVDVEEETGYIKVILGSNLSPKQQEQANVLIQTMLLALGDIAEQYPQYVRVNM